MLNDRIKRRHGRNKRRILSNHIVEVLPAGEETADWPLDAVKVDNCSTSKTRVGEKQGISSRVLSSTMNVLSGALNYIAGNDLSTAGGSVKRLVERIKTSALPQDRRKSVRELTKEVKEGPHRQAEIQLDGLKTLFAVLEQDRHSQDTVEATLELLISVCGALDPPPPPGNGEEPLFTPEDFGRLTKETATENTAMFAELPNAVSLVTELLEDEEFYIRFNALELLSAMVGNCPQLITSRILSSPMGVSRLVDLLNDSRDIIRNDGLLLLIALSRNSEELAKILTFENIFDKLFTIINTVKKPAERTEDDAVEAKENALLVNDCLQLLKTLVRASNSNRAYFREAGCIPMLVNLFPKVPGANNQFLEEDFRNMRLVMEVTQCLVCESDPDVETNRYLCVKNGLLNTVQDLGFATNFRTFVRISALQTTLTLLRNSADDKKSFGESSSRPFINAFNAMCSESSSAMRYACFLLLQEALTEAKGASSSAMLNCLVNVAIPTDDCAEVQWMKDLSSRLKTTASGWPAEGVDGASVFYSSQLLGWSIDKSLAPKHVKSRLLAAKVGSNRENFLSKCVRSLNRATNEGGPTEVRVALLQLLCTWLYNSAEVVSAFLSSAMNLPLLVDVITRESALGDLAEVHVKGLAVLILSICLVEENSSKISRATVVDVVKNRVGIANFTARLDELKNSEAFSALNIDKTDPNFLQRLIDTELSRGPMSSKGGLGHAGYYSPAFREIFEDLYAKSTSTVMQLLTQPDRHDSRAAKTRAIGSRSDFDEISNGEDAVVTQYKEIIRSQDQVLQEAREEIVSLKKSMQEAQAEMDRKENDLRKVWEEQQAQNSQQNLATAEEAHRERVLVLEGELENKTMEMEGLASAYAQLEEDLSKLSGGDGAPARAPSSNFDVSAAKVALSQKLEDEKHKCFRLETQLMKNEIAGKEQSVELAAIARERDALRSQLLATSHGSSAASAVGPFSENAELMRRAEIAETKLRVAEERARDWEGERESLTKLMMEAERKLSDAENDSVNIESEVKSLEHNIVTLKTNHRHELELLQASGREREEQLSSQVSTLEASMQELQARDAEKDLEHLRGEKTRLQETISKLETELENSRLEREKGEKAKVAAEQERQEITDTLLDVRNENESLKLEHLRESEENRRLAVLVREMQASSEAATEKDVSKSEEAARAAETIAELKSKLFDTENRLLSVTEELEKTQKASAGLTDQIIRLSERLAGTEDSRVAEEETLTASEERIDKLQQALDQALEERDAVLQRTSSSSTEMADIKAMLSETQTALREAEDELEMFKTKQVTQTVGEVVSQDLRSELADAEEGQLVAERRLKDLRAEMEKMQGEHANAIAAQTSRQEEARKELERELSEIRRSLIDEKDAQTSIRGDVMRLEATVTSKDESLQVAEKDLASLQASLEAKTVEVASLTERLSNMERALTREKSDKEEALKERDSIRSELSEQKQDVNDIISRFESNESELDQKRKSLETQVLLKSSRINELELLLGETRSERDTKSEELRIVQEEHEALKASQQMVEERLRVKSEQLLTSEKSREDLVSKTAEMEGTQQALTEALARVQTLEKAVLHKVDIIDRLDEDLGNAGYRVEELEEKLKEHEKSESCVSELEAKVNSLSEEKERLSEELSAQCDALVQSQEKLASLESEIERSATLEDAVAEASKNREELSKEISVLHKKAERLQEQLLSSETASLERQKLLKGAEEEARVAKEVRDRIESELESLRKELEDSVATASSRELILVSEKNRLEEAVQQAKNEGMMIAAARGEVEQSVITLRERQSVLESEKEEVKREAVRARSLLEKSLGRNWSSVTSEIDSEVDGSESGSLVDMVETICKEFDAAREEASLPPDTDDTVLRTENHLPAQIADVKRRWKIAEEKAEARAEELVKVREKQQELEERLAEALFQQADLKELLEEEKIQGGVREQGEERLKRGLEDLETKVNAFEAAIAEKEQSMERLRTELEEQVAATGKAEQELEKVREERQVLFSRDQEVQTVLMESGKALTSLSSEVKTLQSELALKDANVTELETEVKTLQKELQSKAEKVTELELEVEKLSVQLDATKQGVEEAVAKGDAARSSAEAASMVLEDYKGQIDALNSTVLQREKDAGALRTKVDELQQEMDFTERLHRSLEEELTALKVALKEKEEIVSQEREANEARKVSSNAELASLRKNLDEKTQECENLYKEEEELRGKLSSAEEKEGEIVRQWTGVVDEKSQQLETVRSELLSLQNRQQYMAEFEAHSAKTETALDLLTAEKEALMKENDHVSSQLEEVKNRFEQMKDSVELIKQQTSLLSEQLDDKRKLLSLADETHRDLQQRIEELEASAATTNSRAAHEDLSRIADLQVELEQAKEELEEAKGDRMIAEQDLQKSRSAIGGAEEMRSGLEEVLRVVQKHLALFGLPNRREHFMGDNTGNLDWNSIVSDVESDLEALRDLLESKKNDELQAEANKSLMTHSDLDAEVQKLTGQLQTLQTAMDSAEERHLEELASMKTQVSSDSANQKALQQRVNELESMLKESYREASRLRLRHDENAKRMNSLSSTTEELTRELAETQSMWEQEKSSMESSLTLLQQEKDLLETKLAEASCEKDVLETKARELSFDVEKRKDSILDLRSKVQVLEAVKQDAIEEMKTWRESAEDQRNVADARIEEIQELVLKLDSSERQVTSSSYELSQATAKMTTLEEELSATKATIDRMRRTRDMLEEENGRLRSQMGSPESSSKVRSLEREALALKEERGKLLDEIRHMDQQLDEFNDIKNKLATTERQKASLEQRLAQTREEAESLMESRRTSERLSSERSMLKASHESEVGQLQTKLREAEQELATALEERMQLEDTLEETKQVIALYEDYSRQAEDLQKKVDDLMLQAAASRREAAEARSSQEAAEDRLLEFKRKASSSEGASSLVGRIRRLESTCREKDTQLMSMQNEFLEQRHELEQELQLVRDQKSSLEHKVREIEADLSVAGSQFSPRNLATPFHGHEAALDREERIIDLEQERDDLRASVLQLQSTVDRMHVDRDASAVNAFRATGGQNDVGPNGLPWHLEYQELQKERDEVLQVLAEMELENT